MRGVWPGLLASTLLASCAIQPVPDLEEAEALPVPVAVPPVNVVKVDETAMLPLLGYLQLLHRMSSQELVRERSVLAAIPQTPATQVRMAMLLGLVRGPMDLVRAQGLLEGVLKSSDPVAVSLNPLVRVLATQYHERLRLEMQKDKLTHLLNESVRRSTELQEKLDALADIERSLPTRPKAGENLPGASR
jgi:hypothetical protein